MSKLTFKEDEYSIIELIRYRATGKKVFNKGEVKDELTGEIMDIQEIDNLRDRYFEEIKENANIILDKKSNRLKWATNQDIKELSQSILQGKYNNNTIKSEELLELIHLKKEHKREPFGVRYSDFLTLNIGKKLPNSLSFSDKGKFYDMLYFLAYDSVLKHTPRKNGRVIKKEDLMEVLGFNNYKTYRKFISGLVKSNIIRELKNTNLTRIIIINPTYVNRNIRVDYNTYLCFKNDMEEYLLEEEKAYLIMLGNSDDLLSSYEIV